LEDIFFLEMKRTKISLKMSSLKEYIVEKIDHEKWIKIQLLEEEVGKLKDMCYRLDEYLARKTGNGYFLYTCSRCDEIDVGQYDRSRPDGWIVCTSCTNLMFCPECFSVCQQRDIKQNKFYYKNEDKILEEITFDNFEKSDPFNNHIYCWTCSLGLPKSLPKD